MSNYIYRKIYKEHYGPIPKEENGRSYDIHHIDGNHNNNDPTNLKAVTIQEHYDIHYKQGDWAACHRMSARMELSAEDISELARKRSEKLVLEGRHNWQGGSFQTSLNKKRVEDGTHNFLGGDNVKERYAKGLPPWGTKEQVSERTKKQTEEGKHPWQIKLTCPVCNKTMPRGNYVRYGHGDNCKHKTVDNPEKVKYNG